MGLTIPLCCNSLRFKEDYKSFKSDTYGHGRMVVNEV